MVHEAKRKRDSPSVEAPSKHRSAKNQDKKKPRRHDPKKDTGKERPATYDELRADLKERKAEWKKYFDAKKYSAAQHLRKEILELKDKLEAMEPAGSDRSANESSAESQSGSSSNSDNRDSELEEIPPPKKAKTMVKSTKGRASDRFAGEDSESSVVELVESESESESDQAAKKATAKVQLKARQARKKAKKDAAKVASEDWGFKDRNTAVAALAQNFLGHTCIEEDKHLQRKQPWLAGYLGLKDTQELGVVCREALNDTLLNFLELKNRGFDVPNVKKGSTYSFSQVIKEISKGTKALAMWQQLSQVRVRSKLSLDDPCFDAFGTTAKQNSSIFPRAVYCAQVLLMVKKWKKLFPESNSKESMDEPKWGLATPNDFHRAFCLLRYAINHYNEKTEEWPTFGKKPAAPVRYLTPEELSTISAGQGDKLKKKAQVVEELREEELLYFKDGGYNSKNVLEKVDPAVALSEQNMDDLVDEATTVEQKIATLAAKKRAKGKSGPKHVGIQRPPLSETARKRFLEETAASVIIEHDAFIGEESVKGNPSQSEEISTAERVAPEEYQDPFKPRKRDEVEEEYWHIKRELATVCVGYPTFKEAAARLGFNRSPQKLESNHVYHPLHPDDPAPFFAKIHQIIATAWQLEQEQGPVGGGINAMDCGLGKSSQTMLLCYISARERSRQYEEMVARRANNPESAEPEEPVDLRPTLIVGPPGTLNTWFTEWKQRWVGKKGHAAVKMLVYYGSERSQDLSDDLRVALLPANPYEARARILKEFPPDQPMSAYGIVWCAYDTLQQRTLSSNNKSEEEKLRRSAGASVKVRDVVTPMPRSLEGAETATRETYAIQAPLTREAKLNALRSVYKLSRKIDAKNRRQDEADSDADDEAEDLDGQTTVYSSVFAGIFYRVVADEGQKLKNPKTRNFAAIETLYNPHTWIVTATPMINRVDDLLGYLCLFWKPEWLTDLEDLDEWMLPSELPTRYQANTISGLSIEAPNYHKRYEGEPMFIYDPKAFATLLNSGRMGQATISHVVLRAILSRIQLRWTMASEIKLGDGRTYQPGRDVPICFVAGVEIRMWPYEANQYQKMWQRFHPYLVQGGGKTDKKSKKPSAEAGGLRDMGVHRHTSLCTFDMRLHSLLLRKERHGAAQAKEWADEANDHGFSQYFYRTRPTPTIPPYLDRLGVLSYLAGESAKLRYACTHIRNALYGDANGRFQGKVTFYVNWPTSQWLMDCLFYNLGLKYFSIWPDSSQAEKEDILTRFNDAEDETLFLVVNSRSSALGLNIQGACHKIVILDMPDNISTVLQIIGRVHRIGQTQRQFIWITCVLGTYDQWLFANATAKMLAQVTGEAKMVHRPFAKNERERMIMEARKFDNPEDAHQIIQDRKNDDFVKQAEEYIRVTLGQRTSRLSWRVKELEYPHRQSSQQTPKRRHDSTRDLSIQGSIPMYYQPAPSGTPASVDSVDSVPGDIPVARGKVHRWNKELLYVEEGALIDRGNGQQIDPRSTWVVDTQTGFLINPVSENLYDHIEKTWYNNDSQAGELMGRIKPEALVPGYDYAVPDKYDLMELYEVLRESEGEAPFDPAIDENPAEAGPDDGSGGAGDASETDDESSVSDGSTETELPDQSLEPELPDLSEPDRDLADSSVLSSAPPASAAGPGNNQVLESEAPTVVGAQAEHSAKSLPLEGDASMMESETDADASMVTDGMEDATGADSSMMEDASGEDVAMEGA